MSQATVSKLAPVVASFWVMKISATTLGETAGDLISMTLHVGYAASSLILISIFFVALCSQLAVKRYHPPLYWTVILATSMAGTTMSDYMDRTLDLGYPTGAALLLGCLLAILTIWRLAFGTLSVDEVRSRPVELLYWIAILFSNTLGTALGDFLSDSSGLGFAGGAILIASLLALTLVANTFTRISRVFLFWVAFVLTRPFGAELGDVLTKPHDAGGLALGTVGSSAVLAVVLVVSVTLATLEVRRQAAPAV